MARFTFRTGDGIKRELFSIGRTGAMKNVMGELKKIIKRPKKGKNTNSGGNNTDSKGIDWQPFVEAFKNFGFTAVYDRNMAILITALFAAIASAKEKSTEEKNKKLYDAAEKVIRTKTSATITNAATNKGQSITLGQALLNGDGKAAHDILNNETFKNALGNIGLQGIFFTKFLNRVKKITPWRLSGSKKALGIVKDAFEAMTGVEYKTGNPLLESANEALKCDDSLIPQFFSCLNSEEAEFLYKKFPNRDNKSEKIFADFEECLDNIKKLYKDIESATTHDKQRFLLLMRKVVEQDYQKEECVNIIENIIKTMDNGKYKAGIEYNANTCSKDVNEIVKKYKKMFKSGVTWNSFVPDSDSLDDDLKSKEKRTQIIECLDMVFPVTLPFSKISEDICEDIYDDYDSCSLDASEGPEEFKEYLDDIGSWLNILLNKYIQITAHGILASALAIFLIIEKIVKKENPEKKLRYTYVLEALLLRGQGGKVKNFQIRFDNVDKCSCERIKNAINEYHEILKTEEYKAIKWKPLGKKEPSPDLAAGTAQAAAAAAAGTGAVAGAEQQPQPAPQPQ